MDPEGWKMATTGYNFLKHRNETTLQANHVKHSNTERLQKKMFSDSSEAKLLQGKVRSDCGTGFSAGKQIRTEMVKAHTEQNAMTSVSKYTVKKWNTWTPDSMEHIENLAFTNYDRESQIVTKQGFGVQVNKFPIQIKDKTQFNRDHMVVNYSPTPSNTKEPSIVPSQKAKIQGNRQSAISEAMLQSQGTEHCEKSRLKQGNALYHSHKKVTIQNNPSPYSRLSGPWQRNKVTGRETPASATDKGQHKILEKHRLSCKDTASVSTLANKGSGSVVRFKTGTGMLYRKTEEKIKLEPTTIKPQEKPAGNKKYRRFLLIDSQGLPYTVVVDETKTADTSKPPDGPASDSSCTGTTKSVTPRKVYKCPVCFRIFEYLSYLQRHSIAHSQQKPHVCKICGKAFKRTSHLTRHKYTHFGGKPCQCQICHRRFRDSGELTRHQQSHAGERPYQCDICLVRFEEQNALQHHLLSKHVK
ncbi:hypothetical protein XENTR_v10019133 [Xenopus tropicalis]|uniref:Zinc finger protein 184 n=1 Tax=Xenopus tropicalis TaxID=8364 RepID=A0A803J4W5_XENTR|nr:zinc finger protein 184 [Xenopus tropicalis]XP_004916269.1 zinc finger protein 184 [Xenopus tropicalis]KAE8593434.1 hypothetical protein XENTR_v10019133 [Xenopus tropicalis]|eukprot:XP_004916267.1 PREDICTED: zinc finger protein 184-like [Xenopus tropicalis]